VTRQRANFFAVNMVRGMVSARMVLQCWGFAALIDWKYPGLGSLEIALWCASFEAQAFREDELNSFWRVVSSGDHHGLALIQGGRKGVWALRSATSVLRCELNLTLKEMSSGEGR